MDPFISDVSSLVAAGAHLRHADRPFLPDLLAHQAGAALHQGAAGGRAGRRDQVVRPPLPQRQPAGASGLCVALPLQVSEPPSGVCVSVDGFCVVLNLKVPSGKKERTFMIVLVFLPIKQSKIILFKVGSSRLDS